MIQKFWCPTGDKSDTISEKWSFSHSLFFSNEKQVDVSFDFIHLLPHMRIINKMKQFKS